MSQGLDTLRPEPMCDRVRRLLQAAWAALHWTTLTPMYNSLCSWIYPRTYKTEAGQDISTNIYVCNLSACLDDLISTDGAGSWPPRASSDLTTWPVVIRPYHAIYHDMARLLTETREKSLDPLAVHEARHVFRKHMRHLLSTRIDLPSVDGVLRPSEAVASIAPDARNAFSACIAMLRHSYRWAAIPASRVAQEDKVIEYPQALSMPWQHICTVYGFESQAGNAMTNFLFNHDDASLPMYGLCLPEEPELMSTQFWFTHMLIETERRALPVYNDLVDCLCAFERGDRKRVLHRLVSIKEGVRAVVKVFLDNMTAEKIDKRVWARYVQAFHSYGAGVDRDGSYIEYHGVSGNQLPFFSLLDAFLGLTPFVSGEELRLGTTTAQRALGAGLKKHSFRRKLTMPDDRDIEGHMTDIAKQLRVWRAAHKSRIVPHLSQSLPERKVMISGRSIVEEQGAVPSSNAVAFVHDLLNKQIAVTR